MAGARRERAILPPPGHPAIDQRRIFGPEALGAEPEPLHHAGTEAFDEPVGAPDQRPGDAETRGAMEINRARAHRAHEQYVTGRKIDPETRIAGPFDTDTLGSDISGANPAHRVQHPPP